MNTTQAQQKALDDALVAPADRLEFGKCNMRLKIDIKPKEATFQVVLDALALTPFYQAFLITAEVPAIYMQEFWATVSVHKQKFEDLPMEHDILSFIRDLGHSGDIIYLSDVSVDYLHQPWRAFATIINKCLSGKETGMDKIPGNKKSKTQFHRSHASGLGDRVDSQLKVPDEQHLKMIGADEGTGTIPGVPNVPKYDFESDIQSWGDSEENDDDDDDGNDDHDDDSDDERTESDRDEIPDPNLTNVAQTEHEEEDVNERVHTPSNYELTDDEMIHDEEKIDDEEMMDEEEEDEVTKT
ncbi:hypothetical protein Tco_1254332 [Tanacetum coccineum]